MVTLKDSLEWHWNGINSEDIKVFLSTVDQMPLTILRGSRDTSEERCDRKVDVRLYGAAKFFIVSPVRGSLYYIFENFKRQGFGDDKNTECCISLLPRGQLGEQLNNYEVLRIGDHIKALFLSTKPLDTQ